MTDSKTHQDNTWIVAAIILTAITLTGILAFAFLTTAGIITRSEIIQPTAIISIDKPVQGEYLDLTWSINVRGHAAGLSESSVEVWVLDSTGNLLAQAPAVVNSPGSGTAVQGSWSADLRIDAPAGSQGQIVAFSPSPVDGSWLAEDRIDVGFGESPFQQELVKVEDHLWALVSLNEHPPTADTLLTLQFEGFQATGFGGCNKFRSSYERNGNNLKFGFVTSTARECELPPGVLVQESAYFKALEDIASFQIEHSQFTLIDNSGTKRLVYDAVIIGTIIGPSSGQLPEDGKSIVKLIDSTQPDPETNLIAEQVIQGFSQFPIPFSLVYNPKRINDKHVYTLVVQIEDSTENLVFTNPAPSLVFTDGYPYFIDVQVENNHE